MNLIPSRLSGDSGEIALPNGGICKLAQSLNGNQGSEFTIAIRPEHISLVLQSNQENLCCLEALVELVEPLGADTVAHCTINGLNQKLNTRLPGDCPIAEGERLNLAFSPKNLHLFDAQIGVRL